MRPREAFDWFHHAIIGGYGWVMGPKTVGMATYADGGRTMPKVYWEFLDRRRQRG